MKFEEILTLLRDGKKAHSKLCYEDYYLFIENSSLKWFYKISGQYFVRFDGTSSILNDDWEIYEEETTDNKPERKLIDFTVSYHRDADALERVKNGLIDDGWEFFKSETEHHPQAYELMTHKLMMVKYEHN